MRRKLHESGHTRSIGPILRKITKNLSAALYSFQTKARCLKVPASDDTEVERASFSTGMPRRRYPRVWSLDSELLDNEKLS